MKNLSNDLARTLRLILFSVSIVASLNSGAQIITTAVGNGTAGYTGDGGQATAAEVFNAEGLAFDRAGNMYSTATIYYNVSNGCGSTSASTIVTVNTLPSAGTITGTTAICVGDSITLSNAVSGGIWSSGSTGIATAGSATGVINGVSAGTSMITYTVTNGCGSSGASRSITVNPLPAAGAISGATILCVGAPVTLSDGVSGGIWSSSNTAIATVGGASGVATGVAAGTDTIIYSVTTMCGTALVFVADTIIALPAVDTIVGIDSVCEGDTIHLSEGVTDGYWSASNGNAATDAFGAVTGITAGTDTIHYTVTTICGTATASLVMHVISHEDCNLRTKPTAITSTGIKVYPNPNGGMFKVALLSASDEVAHLVISNVLGEIMNESTIRTNTPSDINIHAAPGTYFFLRSRQAADIMCG